MAKVNWWKQSIKNKLSVFFENEGYMYDSNKEGIELSKKTEFGMIKIGFQIIKTVSQKKENFLDEGIKINDFVYTIRHNIVEEICYNFSNTIDENAIHQNVITVGSTYGKIIGEKYYSIGEAYNEKDVENMFELIKSIYNDYLKVRIEKYSDIILLEKEFNMDTERELPFSPIYWRGRRSMRGLILAKLRNNPRYEELKIIYRQKCIEQEDADVLEAYDKLSLYLDHEYKKA